MTKKRQYKSSRIGQADIFGEVEGLDKLVTPPEVIESDGLKVIHYVIKQSDREVPGYPEEVKEQARRLAPEVKSRGKPPWMNAEYQARRRKEKAGII